MKHCNMYPNCQKENECVCKVLWASIGIKIKYQPQEEEQQQFNFTEQWLKAVTPTQEMPDEEILI